MDVNSKKRMKNLIVKCVQLFCIAFMLQSNPVFAQIRTITGTVYNGISGKPIAGITVEVKGVKATVQTKATGEYLLEIPDTLKKVEFAEFAGKDIMEIKYLSENEINIYLADNEFKSLLGLSIEDLMKIKVITAGKQEQQISDVPASVVVITRTDIENYGFNSIEEILQSIPGLYMVEQYNWTGMTGFGVRGFFAEGSFSNMVIMVNGSTALREGYINQYILARIGIPVEAIDRIEIIRGPMSVIYGNGAFFGAINIITNSQKTSESSKITSMFGSNNTQKYALRVESNTENVSLAFNIGFFSTDGVNQPYSKMTSNPMVVISDLIPKTYLESVGLTNNATTANQLSQNNKHFSVTGKFKGFTFDVGSTRAEKGILWLEPSAAPNGQNVLINGSNANFQYQQPVGEKFNLHALLTYGAYNSITRYNTKSTAGAGFSNINSTNLFFEVNGIYKPTETADITLGVVRETMLNASNDVDISKLGVANSSWRIKLGDQIIDHEVYTQINYKPTGKLHVIGGIRATKYGNYTYQRLIDEGLPTAKIFEKEFIDHKMHITWRLAAILKLNESNIFKIMYGTAIISPNMRQNVTRLDLSGGYRTQLEPSSIETYEIAYNAIFSSKIYSTLAVFQNNLDKIIESSGALDDKGTYMLLTQNTGKIQTNGAEYSLQLKPMKSLDIQLSASYQLSKNNKQSWENIALGYSPQLLGYIKIAYKLNKKITISANGNFVDEMETSWQQKDIDPQIGARYGALVPAYFCLNANFLVKDMLIRGMFFNTNIINLTNAEIRYANDPGNRWADKGFVTYGRRIMVRIGYEF